MNTLRIHHIGYLVKKISPAIESFKALGFSILQDVKYDEFRKVDICFMEKDSYCIELVCPKDKDSVVYNLLKKYKNCPYHICYESDKGNFENDLEYLTSEGGYVAIDTPSPAPCIDSRKVVFLMSPSLGMIELLENP